MDIRDAEKLFVLITSNVDQTYTDECNMIIDVFLEDDFTVGQLKRMLLFLLDKVNYEKQSQVRASIEQQIGNLEEQ